MRPSPSPPRLLVVVLAVVVTGLLAVVSGGGTELSPDGDAEPPVPTQTDLAAPADEPDRSVSATRYTATAGFTIGGFSECDPSLSQRLVARRSAVVPPPLEAIASTGWRAADFGLSACRNGVRLVDLTLGWQGLVAVGWHQPDPGGDRHALVWASRDGLSWFLQPDDGVFHTDERDLSIEGVAAIDGVISAVGKDCSGDVALDCRASLWRAPLGERWHRLDAVRAGFGDGEIPLGVEAVGSILVAHGRSGSGAAVWTSPDGVEWERELLTNARRRILGLAGGQDGTVVAWGMHVGSRLDRHSVLWVRGQDGSWKELEYDSGMFGGPLDQGWFPAISEVEGYSGGFVAVGRAHDEGAVWHSIDGTFWSAAFAGQTGRLDHVVRLGTEFVAWTRDGSPSLVSKDGTSWERANPSPLPGEGATRAIVRSLIGTTALVDAGTTQLWTVPTGRL